MGSVVVLVPYREGTCIRVLKGALYYRLRYQCGHAEESSVNSSFLNITFLALVVLASIISPDNLINLKKENEEADFQNLAVTSSGLVEY
ncbi:Hypothetical predicted protein [Paramuricea clavata]|uniref:Uncharacterized protein n=1 Tax=Paramuricea clavata TaxID=317549 RepID=A0A6S7G6L6_PARCT|nr:Hypothetical predicted protein [Paramuricea clavata]